jgi:sigma-B regulation protein RsbU (phosphoserine phosphatase)
VRAARPPGEATQDKLLLSRTLVGTVLEERQALLLNDALQDPRFATQESIILQRLRSAMAAPLFDDTRVIGLLYADSDDPATRYDRNQLRAFTLLANLIAVQISNARLMEAEREKERMAREVATAAQVQRRLLPASLPEIPGHEIAGRQLPCLEVAGDLYEVTTLDDGRLAIVLGDVTGKGLGAALLMSNVLAALRVLFQECPEPTNCADRLHRQLLQSSDETRFATLFLGLLDPATGHLDYVNAGHNPPYLLQADGTLTSLDATGMPLGLIAGATYAAASVELPPASLLGIFSDGITEAEVADEFYGEERFLESLRRRFDRPLLEILEGALDDLQAFLGEAHPGDDVTLLLLRRAADPASPPESTSGTPTP